jgi:hypothetical protein
MPLSWLTGKKRSGFETPGAAGTMPRFRAENRLCLNRLGTLAAILRFKMVRVVNVPHRIGALPSCTISS